MEEPALAPGSLWDHTLGREGKYLWVCLAPSATIYPTCGTVAMLQISKAGRH